jgi:hypothetical protein
VRHFFVEYRILISSLVAFNVSLHVFERNRRTKVGADGLGS